MSERPVIKILQIHNLYREVGGEEVVIDNERKALESRGHTVAQYIKDSKSLNNAGIWSRLATGISSIYSLDTFQKLRICLEELQPDIAHFHNTFPLVSPSAYEVCKRLNIPVVQTLHNFRLTCLNAMHFKDGKTCFKCTETDSLLPGLKLGCYQNSSFSSLAPFSMLSIHRALGTYVEKVDRYIALTEFSKNLLIRSGIEASKITVKGNFLPTGLSKFNHDGRYALFVGRLSREKGIEFMLEAWRSIPQIPLKIVGSGPLEMHLQSLVNNPRIEFLGRLEKQDILKLMQEATLLAFPSRWPEGFPMVIAEAFSCGLPVVAPNLGGIPEIVRDNDSGLIFESVSHSSFTTSVRRLFEDKKLWEKLSSGCMSQFERDMTASKNMELLENVYQEVTRDKH